MYRITRFLLVFAIALIAIPIHAQETEPIIAAVTSGQLTLYGIADSPVVVDPNAHDIVYPSWNGSTLVYLSPDPDGTASLKIVRVEDQSASVLASGLELYFPPTIDPATGDIVYFDRVDDAAPPGQGNLFYGDIMAIAPIPGATPTARGRFVFEFRDCGGHPPNGPVDFIYQQETGLYRNSRLVFQLVNSNTLIYSSICEGGSVYRLDLMTGEQVLLGEYLSQTMLSPDGTKLAAFAASAAEPTDYNTLVVFDIVTGTILGTYPHDRWWDATWSADNNSLLLTAYHTSYSGPLYPAEASSWFPFFMPEAVARYSANLYRLDLLTGDTSFLTGGSYIIGGILTTPDPAVILFIAIPDDTQWVNALTSGEIEPADQGAMLRLHPVALYQLDMTTGMLTLLGEDMARAAVTYTQ